MMSRKNMKDRIGKFSKGTSSKEIATLTILNTRVPKRLFTALTTHLVKRDISMQKFITQAIENELQRQVAGWEV